MVAAKSFNGGWVLTASIISLCNLTTAWVIYSHLKHAEDATGVSLVLSVNTQADSKPLMSENSINKTIIRAGQKVNGFSVSSEFGPRISPGGIGSSYHRGVDIAMAIGTPVLMPLDGSIVCHDKLEGNGAGTYAFIHPKGTNLELLAAHLSACHGTGTYKKGEAIGLSGNTGNSTGPHLHWGQRLRGGKYCPPQRGYAELSVPQR